MKTASVQSVIALSLSLGLAPAGRAADAPEGVAKIRDGATELGHSVAAESKSVGHTVADTSTHAGHAIADTARRIGLDIKAGAQKVRAAVVHDGSGPKD